MTVEDRLSTLGTLLEEGCDVPVATHASSADLPDATKDAIALLPLSLLRTGRTSSRRPTIEARLRVLALPSGASPVVLLGRMLVAVDAATGFDCETKDLPADTWQALGVTMRPALVVSAPVSLELERVDVPDVLRPVVVTIAVSSVRRGILLGPGDVPLAGAHVWADRNEEPVRTDARGHFQALVIDPGSDHRLVIHFKDHVLTGRLPADEGPDPAPAIIRFERWEDAT